MQEYSWRQNGASITEMLNSLLQSNGNNLLWYNKSIIDLK